MPALVMNCLAPLITHSPPSSLARVRTLPASIPPPARSARRRRACVPRSAPAASRASARPAEEVDRLRAERGVRAQRDRHRRVDRASAPRPRSRRRASQSRRSGSDDVVARSGPRAGGLRGHAERVITRLLAHARGSAPALRASAGTDVARVSRRRALALRALARRSARDGPHAGAHALDAGRAAGRAAASTLRTRRTRSRPRCCTTSDTVRSRTCSRR